MRKPVLLVSNKYSFLFSDNKSLSDFDIIFIPENPNVDLRLSGHTDLSVFKLSSDSLIVKEYLRDSDASKALTSKGISLIFDNSLQQPEYPYDCGLNAALLGDKLICCKKATAKTVMEQCRFLGKDFIYVNQGYIKCSVCVLRDNAAITSDPGIYRELVQRGFSAHFINPETIRLEGFNHGFFGGCAFLSDSQTLMLTGKISDENEEKQLTAFLSKLNITIQYLSDEIISDIGGCVII